MFPSFFCSRSEGFPIEAHQREPLPVGVYMCFSQDLLCVRKPSTFSTSKKYHQYLLCQACWARRALLRLFPWPPSHPLQTLAQQHFRTANHEWILVVLQLLYCWTATAGKLLVLHLQRRIHTTGNRKCSLVIEQHLCTSSTRFLFTQQYIRISRVCTATVVYCWRKYPGCQRDQVGLFFLFCFFASMLYYSWLRS